MVDRQWNFVALCVGLFLVVIVLAGVVQGDADCPNQCSRTKGTKFVKCRKMKDDLKAAKQINCDKTYTVKKFKKKIFQVPKNVKFIKITSIKISGKNDVYIDQLTCPDDKCKRLRLTKKAKAPINGLQLRSRYIRFTTKRRGAIIKFKCAKCEDCFESSLTSLDLPSSCEAENGRCIDEDCGNCDQVLFSDGLCENAGGSSPKCCRDCPKIVRCRVTGAGYFTTYYGRRFNFQVPGTYLFSKDCEEGLWEVFITLATVDGEKGAVLESVKINIGNVTVDITQKGGPVSVNGNPVTVPLFSVGDVTIGSIQTPSFRLATIEFLKLIAIDVVDGRSFRVVPDFFYRDRTCGICGKMSDEDSDFTDDPDQLNILSEINQDVEDCPLSGNPSDIEYCENAMAFIKSICTNDIHYATYLYACALAYCMGGAGRAEDVIFDYTEACLEPTDRAVCVMNGHTYYDTFDFTSFQFQAPCKVIFAKDCVGDEWEVTITHKAAGTYTEVEKVTVRYDQTLIDLISQGKQILLNGSAVSVPYNVGGISIYWSDNLINTAVLPGAVVVRFNFEQMLSVNIRQYRGSTCGLCGVWDTDQSNDNPDAQYAECTPTPNPVTCNATQEAEARELCKNMFPAFIDDKCNLCYKSDRVERCMYEYCLGGMDGFCQHARTFIDECFVKHGDDLQLPTECVTPP